MTRHASRRPSPKATGPNVPVENLRQKRSELNDYCCNYVGKNGTHDIMFVFADSHIKNILLNCVSFLSSKATGWIPVS